MLPHPAADSGFGTMLYKAQLSTSCLRANLEQEYQATINFVFKALLEVRPCSHNANIDSQLVTSGILAVTSWLAKWHQIHNRWQTVALQLTVVFSYKLQHIFSAQTVSQVRCMQCIFPAAYFLYTQYIYSTHCLSDVPCIT